MNDEYAIPPSERVVEVDGEQVRLVNNGLSKERVRDALRNESKKLGGDPGLWPFVTHAVIFFLGVLVGRLLTLA